MLTIYEHGFKARNPAAPQQSGPAEPPRRGRVTSFSRKSRKRMLDVMMRLQTSRLQRPTFITLTYHHAADNDPDRHQRDRNAFLTALRRAVPGLQYIWRLEPQTRGTPHFHVIAWQSIDAEPVDPSTLAKEIRAIWHRLADPDSAHHAAYGTHIRQIDSYRKALSYVSKYCAKEDQPNAAKLNGRRWGTSTDLPINAVHQQVLSEVEFYHLRRLVKKFLRSRGGKARRYARRARVSASLSLYCEQVTAELMLKAASQLAEASMQRRPPPEQEQLKIPLQCLHRPAELSYGPVQLISSNAAYC